MKDDVHEEVALKIGNSAYVRVGRGNEGKTFLVMPSKYKELLHEFLEDLEESNAPKLKDVLTKEELSTIRTTIAEELKIKPVGFASGWKHSALRSLYTHLGDAEYPEDINNILGRVKDKNVRQKIRRAYHL